MLRDVFYYGQKPNVHPREKPAKNLEDARQQCTTEHFWIVNEFCDYNNFDWDFDFDFLDDDQVWTQDHNNVWPSQHCKDSGTWLCSKTYSDKIVYRTDVPFVKRMNIKTENWVEIEKIDNNFDFSWHPDPTDPPYIYAWGCRYYPATHKPVLEYRVSGATEYKYMEGFVELLPDLDNYKILHEIEENTFDFRWRPDVKNPPYIYVWGNQHYDAIDMPTIEYHVPGATERHYMDKVWHPKLKQRPEKFQIFEKITDFDYSWVPDPNSPPYIYVWGNQWNKPEDKASVLYKVENATEYKYMDNHVTRLSDKTNWDIPSNIDIESFDFSWEPNPNDMPYIYQFGTQWQKTGGPRYIVEGATEIKYIDIIKAKALPDKTKFVIAQDIDIVDFDYSWHHDETEEPYIYVFGNQYYSAEKMPTIEYHVEGATQYKYVDTVKATLGPNKTNWHTIIPIDETKWDYNWIPDPGEPAYIYVWGNQWNSAELESTVEYRVPGAVEKKYMNDRVATVLPDRTNWNILEPICEDMFDFSWRPNPYEDPYIYTFGNNLYPAEEMPTVEYKVPAAKQRKYVNDFIAQLAPDRRNWEIPADVDVSNFDFSWKPHPMAPPFIYQFGTQWQKTGGPRYITPGVDDTSPIKYIDREIQSSKAKPVKERFTILNNHNVIDFDYSWHPDDTEPPYIYIFGNQYYDAIKMPTIEYRVEGATEFKYIDTIKATLGPSKLHWHTIIPIDDTKWDYNWLPDPDEPAYIYVWGNQWNNAEIESTIEYRVPGAVEKKYMNDKVAIVLPDKTNWNVLEPICEDMFDFSWRPNPYEDPYIYTFGNNLYSPEEMPTVEYKVPGATQRKYVNDIVAQLAQDHRNWVIPEYIDASNFDFSWKPHPMAPPFIYEFGTQWQKTGGPRYIVPGATEINYIPGSKAIYKPNAIHEYWHISENLDTSQFDFSWHPDNTEKPYIYQFGTQWQKTGGPKYIVPGATEIKYVENLIARRLSNKKNWEIPEDIDVNSFDFSWHPDSEDQPYIYQFGTQWQKTGGPRYISDGANENTPVKYVDRNILQATKLPNKKNFETFENILVENFDYSWHPDDTEGKYNYIFGNTQYPAELMPTLVYKVKGATETKFIDEPKAKLRKNLQNWKKLLEIDDRKFDYSWMPHPKDPPYIYVFGNQWNDATIEPTVEYHVPGATQYKYITDIVAFVLPDKTNFSILHDIEIDTFDFSWRPNPKDPPYIYVFGNNQYPSTKMPTILYTVKGASEKKYIDLFRPKLSQNYKNYVELIPCDKSSFDFSWIPDPDDPPYIYVFGNQWNKSEIEPTLEYRVPGATQKKYMSEKVNVLPDYNRWKTIIPVEDSFDFSWRPNPKDPPYIYVFGNQWHKAEVEPTLLYIVDDATTKKYVDEIVAEVSPDMKNWIVGENINVDDFDFSWRPNPGSPPYIYQFGTLEDDSDGPRYVTPDNNGEIVRLQRVYKKTNLENKNIPKYYITTTLEDLIEEHPDELFWAIRKNINYSSFDFDWRPNIEKARYVQVFGSPDAVETQTYFVSSKMYKQGYTDFNFITAEAKVESEYLAELFERPDMFFIDRGNKESKSRYEQLKQRFPALQKARYHNGYVDTIYRCLNKCNTQLAWILNSELDYTDFDFKYYPNPWQMNMVHIFGTQWSHWGTTYMVNKDSFIEDTRYIKIIEHLSNINFVKNRTARAANCIYDVYLIDHGNNLDHVKNQIESKIEKNVITVPYKESYLNTFKNMLRNMETKKEHYIWICSSVCDYANFDFSYICDPFAKENLHVFPSSKQKFGDTFFVDVNRLRTLINDLSYLEDYDKVNYNQHLRTKRLDAPVFIVEQDTHYNSYNIEYDFPYALFQTKDNENITCKYDEPMSLWAEHTKNIEILSTGGSILAIPKQVKDHMAEELYDYPYIKKSNILIKSNPLDIVYLSNGEKLADENYEHLLKITKGLPNRIVRVDGVNGRAAAYHAAARASNTPWMFTIFAKLKVDENFDWTWQPDRLQIPKHYIFQAINPVNGLVYGHQAMIAYNKKLALNNKGRGLDFTLDDPHEVLEILSGVALFNTDAYSTWRTSFREVIKLKSDYADISQERLQVWLTKADGAFAENCLQGAHDAVEYYDQVNGDIDQLKLTYEWEWLKQYYDRKYK